MQTVTAQWLQSTEEFHDVPEEQLQWWIDNSEHKEYAEGEFLFRKGDPIVGTNLIVSGEIRVFINQQNGERTIANFGPMGITGYLPFSRIVSSAGHGIVEEKAQIMYLTKERMREIMLHSYELTRALVHVMTARVRTFTAFQQQNEKMMALGKLSAGLAHELNNPAAAIVRGSLSLKKHLQLLPETFKRVMDIKISSKEVDDVNNKLFEVLGRKDKPLLTMMERTSLEDDLAECLVEHQVDNSDEVAENLVEFGFTCEDLNEIASLIPDQYLPPVLNWINNNLVTEKMVNDIQESSQRIDKLINSIKVFTHMDRGSDKEYADIHQGISNTLTMLDYKRRKGNIVVEEQYDPEIPQIKVFIGELNQVWTNLIDNAIDAMEINKQGKLEIKTVKDKKNVIVTITDNGPGVPEEIRSRIFDPFFTTKEIGKGTGMGLDVVNRIVQQHHGTVEVESVPGKTSFKVCFPIQ